MSSALEEFRGARAGEAADGVYALLAVVVRVDRELQLPGVVTDLLEALHVASLDVAASGGPMEAGSRVEPVEAWGSPADAGHAVGLSARRVRELAQAGVVRARRPDARSWLVDVDDLRRYLGRTA